MLSLSGLRIAVPRMNERAGELVDALRARGAEVHDLALTRLEALDPSLLQQSVRQLQHYGWVLLAAPGAVDSLATAIATAEGAGTFSTRRLAVAGASTLHAVRARSWDATVHVVRPPLDALLDALAARSDVEGTHVLYPAVVGLRDAFPDGLRALGATVDVVPVGRHVPDEAVIGTLRLLLRTGRIDLVAVSTITGVDALLDAVPAEQTRRTRLACIGPMTARAARSAGFSVVVEATTPTVDGMVSSIVASFSQPR